MSGLGAVFHRDGQPASAADVGPMMAAMAFRGPDGGACAARGPVALGFLCLATTPEAAREHQPAGADEAGGPLVVLDGRLDGRAALAAELAAAGEPPRGPGDAELVLCAYRAWGDRFAERLLGDFAVVLWDPGRRRLICARDPTGLRPLCYHASRGLFLCASEVAALLAHPAVTTRPDPGMVAEYLSAALSSTEDTLYADIKRLPPGHQLVVEPTGLRRLRFFAFDVEREESRASPEEHAAEFNTRFRAAVRSRLRARAPVGVALSGGLDSSSVAVVAAELAREDPGLPALEAFSQVYPGRPCDETRYIREVVAHAKLPSHELPPTSERAGADMMARARRHRDFPGYPNCTGAHGLLAFAAARGVRVLLTGVGGDEWLQGAEPGHRALEQAARGDLPGAVRALGGTGADRLRGARRATVVAASRLLPGRLWRTVVRARRGRALPRWLDPHFVRKVALADRIAPPPVQAPLRYAGRIPMVELATCAWRVHAFEQEDLLASAHGLELRAPFDDRRVCSFALALPEHERLEGSTSKLVLRRALAAELPARVARRRDKATLEHLLLEALAFHRPLLREPTSVLSRGWVQREPLAAAVTRLDDGRPLESRVLWGLWMLVGIECWLRTSIDRV